MEQLPLEFVEPESRDAAGVVLRSILGRHGRANAISLEELAQRSGLSTREIQALVKVWVEDEHLPIGAAFSRPFGYFVISSNAERVAVRNHFVRRALSNLEHGKAYDTDSIVAPLIGQLEILVSDDEGGADVQQQQ